MNTIRIDIGLGDPETDEEGFETFEPEISERIEITALNIKESLDGFESAIINMFRVKLIEIRKRLGMWE